MTSPPSSRCSPCLRSTCSRSRWRSLPWVASMQQLGLGAELHPVLDVHGAEHDVHGTVQLDPPADAGRGVDAGEQVALGLIGSRRIDGRVAQAVVAQVGLAGERRPELHPQQAVQQAVADEHHVGVLERGLQLGALADLEEGQHRPLQLPAERRRADRGAGQVADEAAAEADVGVAAHQRHQRPLQREPVRIARRGRGLAGGTARRQQARQQTQPGQHRGHGPEGRRDGHVAHACSS